MDNVLKLRQALNASRDSKDKISLNDFIVKATAAAIQDVPEVNSSWQKEFIRQYANADICVATATPNGLITPILFKVETKGLATISKEIKELARRARENALKPHEFQGGTFTISNLGMYGIDQFNAIINPPQACILAVGATKKKVIPTEDGEGYIVANMMSGTLSCDHRMVDGAMGSQWLQAWKAKLENPLLLML